MRITITRATKPICLPYHRPSSDPKSHSYVDLKKYPDEIASIPEIRGWPALESALVDLNRGDTFRTVGCEKCFCPNADLWGVSGYLQVCFEDLALARDIDSHSHLFGAFEQHAAHAWPDNDTTVEFEMQETVSADKDMVFWSFSIWLVVPNCRSQDEAKQKWSSALRFICGFLLSTKPRKSVQVPNSP